MDYRNFDGQYYIRLDRGDEIVGSLRKLCEEEDIKAASIVGIGGCGRAKIGVFDENKKMYDEMEVRGTLELTNLTGNITEYQGKPYLHAHAQFAYNEGEFKFAAGHLLEAQISLTGEIVLTPANGKIGRKYDEELGIRTWDFA